MEKTFIRVRSVKDILIFSSLIVAGSILIALPTGTGVNITGFFMIFAGIILALILRTSYKDTESGLNFQKKEFYFQQTMSQSIQSALETKPASIDLSQAEKGNAIKLDIYFNKKADKAYLQLFEYVPYKYEPCSKMCEHTIDRVDSLIK